MIEIKTKHETVRLNTEKMSSQDLIMNEQAVLIKEISASLTGRQKYQKGSTFLQGTAIVLLQEAAACLPVDTIVDILVQLKKRDDIKTLFARASEISDECGITKQVEEDFKVMEVTTVEEFFDENGLS
jgi:uncharacterized Zn finger protein